MVKKKFRLSHSLLNLWASGETDRAIETYFRINQSQDPKMMEGRRLHEEWATKINKDKTLTLGLTTLTFTAPITEFGGNGELNKPYNDLWDIGGRFDCIDSPVLYEFKSGVKNGLDYAGEYQLPFYFLLAELAEIKIERAILLHYNQYLHKSDLVIVHNSREQVNKARNWVDSLAPDIFKYFTDTGLI